MKGAYRTEWEFPARSEHDVDLYLTLEIEYDFDAGERQSEPSLSHAGRPGEGPTLVIERAWITGGAKPIALPELLLARLTESETLRDLIIADAGG